MPHLAVSLVKITCITKEKKLHNSAQRNLMYFEQKMDVILHESIGINLNGVSFLTFRQIGQVCCPILTIKKDVLTLVSSGDDMIKSARSKHVVCEP